MKALLLPFVFLSLLFADSARPEEAQPFMVTIPLRIEQGLMFTDVVIDGETYNFLIDTGAPFILSPELAEKINFKSRYSGSVGSSNSKSGVASVGTMRRKVEVGGLKFSNFEATVIDYNSNTQAIRCLGFDGFIGSNFMNGTIWHFDYDNKKAIITNRLRGLPRIKESWQMKMYKQKRSKKPYVPVKVNKGSVGQALFDTGFAGFFDLPYTSYDKALKGGNLDPDIKIVEGRGIMSEGAFGAEDTTGYFMQVPKLSIGKETLEDVEFRMGHTARTKVGVTYLKGRLVTFDYPGKRIYVFEKENDFYPTARESFLFGPTLIDGELVVGSIFKDPESSPLRIGDVILEMNGQRLSDLDECEALNTMRVAVAQEEEMELRLRRADKEFNIKISKSLIFSE